MTHRPPWLPPAAPSRENCVLPCLIDKWAEEKPDREFIRFEAGTRWTWSETRTVALRTAAALQALGIGPGDTVLVWLPNGETFVRTWLGANYLGAVLVPINPSYKGRLLEHVIKTSGARLLIAHPSLVERLATIDPGKIAHVIVAAADLDGDPGRVDFSHAPQLWDTQVIIFTSGTTGPSKGVQTSYLHLWTSGVATYGYIGADDRMLINLPMYHVSGTASFIAAVNVGASIALYDSFNTKEFWTQVRDTGATAISGLIGAMTTFLAKNDPHASDRDNSLKMVTLAPLNETTIALARRFGFDYLTGFNMTELSCPLVTDVNETIHHSCGRPRTGVQCRVVDDHDIEVPAGTIGELIVRSDRPWDQMTAYYGNPEATVAAWRNGWFHTGDLMYCDNRGNFFFVDRKKDAIRRRGENISSLEVEADVAGFGAVREVAAYGVASADGEEDVMIAIAPQPGQSIDPRALLEFLLPCMAHFMLPRYVRVMDALPKTPTNKIQKADLRREGITPDTWDREAAGFAIKRDRL